MFSFARFRGAELIDLQSHEDARGVLVALDHLSGLPFELRRVFFMKVDDANVRRGGHATSSDLLLVPTHGRVTVDLDNGTATTSVSLETHAQGLWIYPGVRNQLRDFSPGAVLMVCASRLYRDTRYFAQAQPDMLELYEVS